VSGKVIFDGKAPAGTAIQMNSDPVCLQQHSTPVTMENVVVNANGTLKNVFIYVKKGLEGKTFPTPTDPVVVKQEGCTYHPHVLGMMVNQPVKFVNGDATLHNVHAVTTVNQASISASRHREWKRRRRSTSRKSW
jgi:plastocyanin